MPISYQAALRILAKEKGHFLLPKKGTEDYEKVRKMMSETAMSTEHETKKRVSKKAAKAKPDVVEMSSSDEEVKHVAAPPPMKNDTKLIDQTGMDKKVVKNVEEKPKASKAKGGVKRSGKTKSEAETSFLENQNTGPSTTVSTMTPDQSKDIKKSLAKKGPKLSVKADPAEQTIDTMNHEATGPTVDGDKQFSFIEFRKKLLCQSATSRGCGNERSKI